MPNIYVEEFTFLETDTQMYIMLPAQKGECENARLTYNGKNVMLLQRNNSLLVLKDIPTNIRPKLKNGRPVILAEVAGDNKTIIRGYTVNLTIDENVPNKDNLSEDFDKDFGFLKEVMNNEEYFAFKTQVGF